MTQPLVLVSKEKSKFKELFSFNYLYVNLKNKL